MKIIVVTALLTVLVLAPCPALADKEQDGSQVSEKMAEPGAEPGITAAPDAKDTGVSERLRHKDRADSIMEQRMDGQTLEAFNASLEKVRETATDAEYKRLSMALDWLLLYDLGARGDRETLYRRLDGKTPNQIIDKIKY